MKTEKLTTTKPYSMIEVKVNDAHQHAYKAHLHSELSIGIIQKGTTLLTINDIDYIFTEGDAVVIMPYVIHNCQPVDMKNWAFTMIYLDDSYKDALTEALSPDVKIGIKKLGTGEFKHITRLTRVLKTEDDGFCEEVEIIDCLNTIIESIDQYVLGELDVATEGIRKYIDKNFLSELSLDALEQRFNINKFKLIRRFKKLYNSTPSAYQLQLKVNHAKQLLKKETDLVEVALKTGFYDQAHFTKEFKKAVGLTPKQYKSQI
jgi:AraC-like DNA-binding protein